MSARRSPATDSTLPRLVLGVLLVLAASAALDMAAGRGGAAWLFGAAAEAETGAAAAPAAADPGAILFRDVRAFDGEAFLERVSVLVRDGRIAEIGDAIEAPADAEVIDGEGLTLLPGLIDSHVHTWGDALRADVVMGVTTVLDMFADPGFAAEARAAQEGDGARDRADILSAGILATAPGGHGTQYGVDIPTLEGPADAAAFVDARREEGSDFIKIIYEDGTLWRPIPTLDLETVAAVIDAAHERGLLAVVHVSMQEAAREVIAAGADGIVHIFVDSEATPDTVELFRESGAFVVPTLAVQESVAGGDGGSGLVADSRLEPYLMPSNRTNLAAGFPGSEGRGALLERALASVASLHAAGVPILAGTDAPNPGTAHGASMHHELVLLQRAGLSPAEALAAATSVPAAAFGLDDRGRIRVGARADLWLVRGDPAQDLTVTREIVGVWKRGLAVDREAYRQEVEAATAAGGQMDTGSGLIADFEDGEVASEFGSGWMVSTDEMMGGSSTGGMAVVDGGAEDSARALEVSGEIAGGAQYAWSGAMFMPGSQPFEPVDLSDSEGFRFALRGEGDVVVVMVFAQSLGQFPAVLPVPVTGEWAVHELSFADFAGVDPSGVMAILFSGSEPGPFSFRIDELRLR